MGALSEEQGGERQGGLEEKEAGPNGAPVALEGYFECLFRRGDTGGTDEDVSGDGKSHTKKLRLSKKK